MTQSKIGWRPYVNLTSVQATANLLDSYSGAAVAYSLRKLRSSYSGSAIRVRRSSDNTELNIGFDSDGNLDTYALSSFVGSGSGFVTTWYDQSGNGNNAAQTTTANQPQIVSAGSVITMSNKPSVKFTTSNMSFTQIAGVSGLDIFVVSNFTDVTGGGQNWNIMSPILAETSGNVQDFVLGAKGSKMAIWAENNNSIFLQTTATISINTPYIYNGYGSSTSVGVGFNDGNYVTGTGRRNDLIVRALGKNSTSMQFYGNLSEVVVYNSLQTANRSGINTNLNTYYSVYPNPSSVWNLLTAAYNADTIASSSLKTSLVAAYNGESNTNDSKGTNNGTAQGGLTYTTGKIGNAFTFNGTNAYVALPNNSMNFPSSSFSVSFWVYLTNINSANYALVSNFANNGINRGWIVGSLTSGKLYFGIYAPATQETVTSATISINTWYHVTCVHTLGQPTKTYINGTLDSTSSTSYNPSIITTHYPTIGASKYNSSATQQYMPNGSKIDALSVWSKELTQSEITELYNSGNGAQYITDNFYKPTTNDALNTYNGTPQGGLTYGVGKVGTAFQFNGTNAFIKYPANSMSFDSDFSISAWVNIPLGYTGDNRIDLLTNITMPYWYNSPKGFWFNIVGNSLHLTLSNGASGVDLSWNDTSGSIIKGNSGWINIVATRKSSTRSNLYVNGILKASNTSTFNPSYSLTNQTPSSGALYIVNSAGVVQNNSVFAPNGTKIDSLNVWNKELSATEVTELYNSGNGKQYPN